MFLGGLNIIYKGSLAIFILRGKGKQLVNGESAMIYRAATHQFPLYERKGRDH